MLLMYIVSCEVYNLLINIKELMQSMDKFKQLQAKLSFSNIVSADQVNEVYRYHNIVEDKRGFTSREQVDEFIELAKQNIKK